MARTRWKLTFSPHSPSGPAAGDPLRGLRAAEFATAEGPREITSGVGDGPVPAWP